MMEFWRAGQKSGSKAKWTCAAAALAGLTGVSGLLLAAAAAHSVPDPRLQTAANFLLLHAAAALAVCGLAAAIPRGGVLFLGAAGLFLSGSLIFGADLSTRAFAGTRLFPMAAPLGGSLLIAGWISVTLAALTVFWQSGARTPGQNIDD
ncbi:MAG TPA: DUF423 domain-containing protein [Methylocella sp.]|jgi:uncharacterized membrane protein YgdD (TMEM256/DUF423 family)